MVLEASTVFTLVGGVRSYHDGYPWERLPPCFCDSQYKERTVCHNREFSCYESRPGKTWKGSWKHVSPWFLGFCSADAPLSFLRLRCSAYP